MLSFAKPTVAGQVSESYHELVFVLGSTQAIFTSLSKPSPRHVQEHFSGEKKNIHDCFAERVLDLGHSTLH